MIAMASAGAQCAPRIWLRSRSRIGATCTLGVEREAADEPIDAHSRNSTACDEEVAVHVRLLLLSVLSLGCATLPDDRATRGLYVDLRTVVETTERTEWIAVVVKDKLVGEPIHSEGLLYKFVLQPHTIRQFLATRKVQCYQN